MSEDPFLVRCVPRPIRVAFLVDPDGCSPELLDAIFDFQAEVWGGRHNPIIPCVAGRIPESSKALLLACDPDIVYSYVDLGCEETEWIDRSLGPYLLKRHARDEHDDSRWRYQVALHERAAIDLASCVARSPRPLAGDPAIVVSRDARNKTVGRIARRCFGAYDDSLSSRKLPAHLAPLVVDECPTVAALFSALADRRDVLFPLDLWSVDSRCPPVEWSHAKPAVVVLVGSDAWSAIWHWNRVFRFEGIRAAQNLWLPCEDWEKPETRDALAAYIGRYAWGGSPPHILVESHEVSVDSMRAFCTDLSKKVNVRPTCEAVDLKAFPVLKTRSSSWPLCPAMTESRHTGHRLRLPVPRPSVLPTQRSGQAWMVDTEIEFQAKRSPYSNVSFSWVLSRGLPTAGLFGASRHTACGLPTILVSDESPFMELSVPAENNLFRQIATSDRHASRTEDLRRATARPYSDLRISDKGRIALGVLDLVGGLGPSWHVFNNFVWTAVFEALSLPHEARVRDIVAKKVEKRLPQLQRSFGDTDLEAARRVIDGLVLWAAKQTPAQDSEVTEPHLRKLVEQADESQDSETLEAKEPTSDPELRRALQEFVDRRIFLQGARPRCTRCGQAQWVSVDDLRHDMRCGGCTGLLHPQIGETWVYRLNELVVNAVRRHGTLPLLSTLGTLLDGARRGFLYIPSAELFEGDDEPALAAECDFMAVVDGRFVLGEVKTRAEEFSDEDLRGLSKICARLRPHECILSAYEDRQAKGEGLQRRLSTHLEGLPVTGRFMIPKRRRYPI